MKTIFPLILLITVSALGTPQATGQEAKKIHRIGLLSSGAPTTPGHQRTRQAFLQGLEGLGYVDGKNIIVEYRYANRKRGALPGLAAELVRLGVDVIVPSGPTVVRPAMKATKTIPIVMPNGGDPVEQGFVKSFSRPGGNVTGVAGVAKGIRHKRVELLKETFPRASRVALLVPDPKRTERAEEYAEAGKKLGMEIDPIGVSRREEFEGAFSTIILKRPHALIVIRNTLTLNYAEQIAEFEIKNRLASMNEQGHFAVAGGLMSYSESLPAMWHRAAVFVDKILKGAKPADLPVEPPPKFEFVINLKTAEKIGVTSPPEILLEANEVIK